ncbi:MAG TPA: SRPBCC domain-containing protein [Polyangia bacterium]|nr:SRPBCC domain-containing protein [Polyangia bacterium]
MEGSPEQTGHQEDRIAKVAVTIDAPVDKVWDGLVSPTVIQKYMAGAKVVSDWKEGSPIVWKGEWKGKPFEDKGTILEIEPERHLKYSHYSPLSGEPDRPESYHTVTIDLSTQEGGVYVALTQNRNASDEALSHSEKNWKMMLEGLKKAVES